MLRIREAFKFTVSELRQRGIFWAELCVLYVVWVNFSGLVRQLDCFGANWPLAVLIQLADLIVYAGIINIAFLASSKQDYALKDIVLKADKMWRFLVFAIIPVCVVLLLTFLMTHSIGFMGALFGIAILLFILLLFIKFSFAPFYIIGENTDVISGVKQSWVLSECPVILSLILYFLAMVIVVLPFSIIDMLLVSCHISVVSLVTPPGLLVLGHLYQQAAHKE